MIMRARRAQDQQQQQKGRGAPILGTWMGMQGSGACRRARKALYGDAHNSKGQPPLVAASAAPRNRSSSEEVAQRAEGGLMTMLAERGIII